MKFRILLTLVVALAAVGAATSSSFATKSGGGTGAPPKLVCKKVEISEIVCPPGKDLLSGLCHVKLVRETVCRPA
jgi:hypothetical protein